jgi:Flp pilus assembly protein TadB
MTGVVVQCPKCVLRFSFRTEMEHHLREDHRRSPILEPITPVEVDEVDEPVATPITTLEPGARRGAAWSPARVTGVILAIAVALLVAYVAVSVSISSAVVIAVVLVVLSLIDGRRRRGQSRVPRR